MPNLSTKDVHKFWHDFHDQMVYKVIAFMESVEAWISDDNPELEKAMANLGAALDNIGYIDLQDEDKIIQLANNLKLGQMLRLLQCMDTAHPGAASKILMFAKNASETADDIPGIFLRRNVVFERMRILGRVFAADRLTAIIKTIGPKKT